MKRIGIIISMILLVGLVTAGIGLLNTDKNIEISKNRLDTLKRTLNLTNIEPIAGEIFCNEDNCIARIFQEGLINDEWKQERGDYSPGELEKMRDEWIKKRLEDYADVQKEREEIEERIKIVEEGRLTFKEVRG